MKSDVKRHNPDGAAKGKKLWRHRTTVRTRRGRDCVQAGVRLPAELDDQGGGIN